MSDEVQKQNDDSPEVLAYRVGQIEHKIEGLEKSIGSIAKTLFGSLITLVISLILLALNLIVHSGASSPGVPHAG